MLFSKTKHVLGSCHLLFVHCLWQTCIAPLTFSSASLQKSYVLENLWCQSALLPIPPPEPLHQSLQKRVKETPTLHQWEAINILLKHF